MKTHAGQIREAIGHAHLREVVSHFPYRKKTVKEFFLNWVHPVEGVKSSFKLEPSLQVEAAALPIAVILGIRYKITPYAWLLMIGSIFHVLQLELLNTAVEEIVRDSHPKRSVHYKRAMDAGAASVAIAIGVAAVCAFYAVMSGIPRDIQRMTPEEAQLALGDVIARIEAINMRHMPLGNNTTLVLLLRSRLALLRVREAKLECKAFESRLITMSSVGVEV